MLVFNAGIFYLFIQLVGNKIKLTTENKGKTWNQRIVLERKIRGKKRWRGPRRPEIGGASGHKMWKSNIKSTCKYAMHEIMISVRDHSIFFAPPYFVIIPFLNFLWYSLI